MAETKGPITPAFHKERLSFKAQLFTNNSPDIKGNTTYEELACVGFQPELNRLEGVVYIKQPVGYGGDICSAGTPEYVRFFLSFDGGATWHNQGITQFTAHDIPAAAKQRLEYAVSLTVPPHKRYCLLSNMVQVRAILSWHVPPPANDANWPPPWGNVHNTIIHMGSTRTPLFKDVAKAAKLELPLHILETLDPEQELTMVEPKELTIPELRQIYEKTKVQPHRYALSAVLKMQSDPNLLTKATTEPGLIAAELAFDVETILAMLAEPKGDTYYEQLDCVGFDPVHSELVATFRVKQGQGYSGNPCTTQGSVEYVTFWGDFDGNGTFETCLGTVGTRVYDYHKVPEHGLEYAVSLPVDFSSYRQPCKSGAKLVKIRAMLSWSVPHPCSSPNKPPVWGNAEDTMIEIPPGPAFEPGVYKGYLYTICGVNICAINHSTGLTTSSDQPFGATLNITGEVPGAAVLPKDRLKYKVLYRSLDPIPGPWQALTNDFWIWVTEGSGVSIPTTTLVKQTSAPGGWYSYLEYGTPVTGAWRRVSGPDRLLGQWGTVAAQTGRWEIMLEFLDTATSITYFASPQLCPDGLRSNAVVCLDQVRPSASLSPDLEVSSDGGVTWTPAKQCGTFVKGVLIRGTYSVSDEHFRALNLYVQPSGPAHSTAVTPSSRVYPFVPTLGETGTWTIDTKNMDPCGYVIRLDVWDRTIVSCDDDGWYNWASLGFCLKEK